MGVDLGGSEPLVTQRDLHGRERRAGGQPRRERMAESVRGTADVKVKPREEMIKKAGDVSFKFFIDPKTYLVDLAETTKNGVVMQSVSITYSSDKDVDDQEFLFTPPRGAKEESPETF